MRRFLLVHEGQRILLPDGQTILGRGLRCNIRFNDPAVSREHLAIVVEDDRATVTNLSVNGTLVNGAELAGDHVLRGGDQLRIGYRTISVEVIAESRPGQDLPVALGKSGAAVDDEQLAEEQTRPGAENEAEPARSQQRPTLLPQATVTPSSLAEIRIHTCPRCRTENHYFDDMCTSCGYTWPEGHPSSVTQKIRPHQVTKRKHPRFAVELPVIYSSATLTIDAVVRDLSRGGMFIESELLDPVGTPCEVTALPDGHAAMQFSGVVAHVSSDKLTVARPSGLGIRFISGSDPAMQWLGELLTRYASDV